MVRVAIVADDLTGALDSVGPFVSHGFSAIVAVSAEQLPEALRQSCDVVAVNTGSREIPPEVAAQRAGSCARLIAETSALPVKKIDSRLKGNIAAELESMLTVLGRKRVVVAPAIPDLGRFVCDGRAVGAGIAEPIPIAERLGRLQVHAHIPDCPDQDALLRIARSGLADDALLVGATGLTQALAIALGGIRREPLQFRPEPPVAFVIGSRDPVTLDQVSHLCRTHPDIARIEAPGGKVQRCRIDPGARGLVLLATPGDGNLGPAEVAAQLAGAAAQMIDDCGVRTIVGSGGETVSALLERLAVKLVYPRGEVVRGVPWAEAADGAGRPITLVTKSGGFGGAAVLSCMMSGGVSGANPG